MQNKIKKNDKNPIETLLAIMERLRDPIDGCAWDLAQTHKSIVPHTIEEAYEVADAVEQNDPEALCDELGDLLLQVVFQAQIAKEAGDFNFNSVANAISAKMIRRHPHIFGDVKYQNEKEQRAAWQKIKAEERSTKQNKQEDSILSGVASTLPPTRRAIKLQTRAGEVGFDWHNPEPIIAKIKEELEEAVTELNDSNSSKLEEEIGDLLFAVINLARKCKIDPDQALNKANAKFVKRFASIEAEAKAQKKELGSIPLETLDAWWQKAKKQK